MTTTSLNAFATAKALQSDPKTVICCFDGTGNQFGENSNIVRLLDLLLKDEPSKQVVYYQPGIGTYSKRQYYTSLATHFVSNLNATLASSLHNHVKGGYLFIMQNYNRGDKICLFGFSRGAYVARVLMGMIYKVGLLPANNAEQVELAYTMYEATDEKGYKLSQEFKRTYSKHVVIDFVGVWDTVASVGLGPSTGSHPYTSMEYATRVFRHALALDERRVRFQPQTWSSPAPDAEQEHDSYLPKYEQLRMFNGDYTPPKRDYADVKEVWFSGCHADVGGGSHPSHIRHSLSHISFSWMVHEAEQANCGIIFTRSKPYLPDIPKSIGAVRSETNILAPIFDQLVLYPTWWILECLPFHVIHQDGDGSWIERRQCNFGAGRLVPFMNDTVLVHSSVRERIEHSKRTGELYVPAASNWRALENLGIIKYVSEDE